MPDTTHYIDRAELEQVFSPRAVRQFEELQRKVAETEETSGAGLEATQTLGEATFVTLSPNAELPNEYVFQVGEGLRLEADPDTKTVTLYSDAPVVTGGFSVAFAVSGPTDLALPLTGIVATREWVNSLAPGPFADDAAAAAGGVAVGEVYRKGAGLAARLV